MIESKEPNFVSAVVYIRNQKNLVADFLQSLADLFSDKFANSEIICVDDFSDDGSADEIFKLKKPENVAVSVLSMSYFHGRETAIVAGQNFAIGDFVFEFDSLDKDFADGEIIAVYQKALQGFDIVSASPKKKMRASSRIFYWLFKKFSKTHLSFKSSRFCLLSRRAINRVKNKYESVPFRKSAYFSCGLECAEHEYNSVAEFARNKVETADRCEIAVDTLALFTDAGWKFSLFMASMMCAFSIFASLYALVVYLKKNPVAGWTTTFLLLSLAFFGIFGILSIVIKYLQILLNLSFRRTRFDVKSIKKME